MYKKTCFEPIRRGGGVIRKYALLLERVGLFNEGQPNREDAAFSSIDSNIYIYIYIYCHSQKGCPVEIYTYRYISITWQLNICVNSSVSLPSCKLRVRLAWLAFQQCKDPTRTIYDWEWYINDYFTNWKKLRWNRITVVCLPKSCLPDD